ncbi:disulfide bond formation protein DsbB [Alishewanella tabrizica]|uniref:Disulfide bond formation protein B n=1 Tax=Alishewanella tabrizica TaxID=671278 RepID=A0ABQ2WNC2_9ALTE|nr:disulfide bond formation protein DsbB [Alishewanella tabrizica]GGW62285.1 disulfide bond formation protein B [Alishewanella tabrizica]
MFRALKTVSVQRWPWLVLALSALLLLLAGLYFQYQLNYQPCIKCIYVRVAFFGIMLAALLVTIAPKQAFLRYLGVCLGGAAAVYGVLQAHELVNIEQVLASGGFTTCALFANFPTWLALDSWFPALFAVTGTCGGVDWQFVGLSMAEWSRFILAVYGLIHLLVFISQLTKPNKNPYL